jgi:hypothetical protein
MRVVAGVVLVAALGTVALAPASGGAPRGFCAAKHSRTVLKGDQARVYSVPFSRRRHAPRTKVACLYATDAAGALDDPGFTIAFGPPGMALRGHLLAFAESIEADGDFPPETDVGVIDLREWDGLTFRTLAGAYAGPDDGSDRLAKVGSIALGSRGTVAWITCPMTYGEGNYLRESARPRPNCVRAGDRDQVRTIDSGKRDRVVVLDRGRDIDPSSLRIRGTRASWVAHGHRRHARLPAR